MLPGIRVRIVEDEVPILVMLKADSLEIGCEAGAAPARLGDGLEIAHSVSMDVAVLVVNLSGTVSYPVADILHRRNIPPPFATDCRTAKLSAGLRGFLVLSKPFVFDQPAKA